MTAEKGASQRYLVSSDLVKEDLLEADHKAVWGSFYDRETRRWGYGCCRGTDKGQPCVVAAAAAAAEQIEEQSAASQRKSSRRDDSSDSAENRRRTARVRERDAQAIDWSSAPSELLPPGDDVGAAALIEHVVRYTVGAWQRELGNVNANGRAPQNPQGVAAEVSQNAELLKQTRDALTTLLQQLSRGKVESSVLAQLRDMLSYAVSREYAAANKVYLELTMGNKRWQNVVAGAQGLHNKGAKITLIPQSKLNAFDSDPAAQKYILGLRRLIQFLQDRKSVV